MNVDLRLWRELSAEDRRDYADLQTAVHGPPEVRRQRPNMRFTWTPLEPDATWLIQVRDEGRLVSALTLIQRTILVDGQPTRAVGVRGVMTHPDFRRRGFGRTGVQRAADFIWQELQPDLALLLSSVMAVPFYESLGWQVIPGPVFCAQPQGTACFTTEFPENPAMVLVPPGRQPPTGTVDLCGLPW